MAVSSSVSVQTGVGLAHDGKLRMSSSESGEPTNGPYEVYVSAWGPGDEVLYESPENTSDPGEISYNAGGNGGYSIDLPLNPDGTYKAGTYRVRFVTFDTDSSAIIDTQEGTFVFTPNVEPDKTETSDLEFTATYDCVTGLITATDTTDMTGWNDGVVGNWRTITLLPPSTVQEPEPSAIEAGSDTLTVEPVTFQFSYTNATYQVVLKISRTKTLSVTLIEGDEIDVAVVEIIGRAIQLDIQCDTGFCDIVDCIEAEFLKVEAAACGGLGWGSLTNQQKAKLEYSLGMAQLVSMYSDTTCANLNKAAYWRNKIGTFLGCGCGCEDTASDGPIPYEPPPST